MRRISVVAIGVLLAGSIAGHAQEPAPATPTFRAGTTLVDFNIVAVDRGGKPVTDLRRDEITILEDEQNRDVAFFQFEGAATSPAASGPAASVPLPAGTFTNRTEYAAPWSSQFALAPQSLVPERLIPNPESLITTVLFKPLL
jgi:hypothetical protein